MGKLGSLGSKRQFRSNVVSVASMNISPYQQVRFHNRQARINLKRNNILGYRYHTNEAVKLNTKIFSARMRMRKKKV
jgi:hypothetical protein